VSISFELPKLPPFTAEEYETLVPDLTRFRQGSCPTCCVPGIRPATSTSSSR
jgi:hypothetical protein